MSITLPTWPAGAMQPEDPFNEAMQALGAIVNAAAETTTNTPPATVLADKGKIWIIGTTPTGLWAGQANQIALCTAANVWVFYAPQVAWLIWDKAANQLKRWSGTAWVVFTDGSLTTIGLYAARPTAASSTNRIYEATDVQERYFSNGTSWVVLPSGCNELGYAEIAATFSTASAVAVDVTGLTVTCKVGERPVVISYGGNMRNTTPGGFARLVANANAVNASNLTVPGTVGFLATSRETRITGLTPGSTYTFKLQLLAISGGTAELYADANDKPYIQVRNA